jgi:protein-tyrosine phosphatase
VTPQLLAHADQVYTMTRSHRECLVAEFPDTAPRVSLLSRDGSDIIDPIGAGLEEYQRCSEQIERHLRQILNEIPAA